MNETELTPAAQLLIDAYLSTVSYSHGFKEDHGQPPNLAAKVHYLRSVAQILLVNDDRFEFKDEYAELGRVQFVNLSTRREYVLRSTSAVAIEEAKGQRWLVDPRTYLRSDVTGLVYRFSRPGLDLSVAGTRRRPNKKRLELSGKPAFIATWPYHPGDGPPFDQSDPYGELGDLGWEEDSGGEDSAEEA
jgi:hypothetical protein